MQSATPPHLVRVRGTLSRDRPPPIQPVPVCVRQTLRSASRSRYGCVVGSRDLLRVGYGEERAFWGLVYRLLDEPTDDDVQCVLA